MSRPFKLKYKNSAFPFKENGDDEIITTPEGKVISKDIEDIREKLEWMNKSEIPNEELQKAYFEQQKQEQNWKKIDNRLERKRMDRDDSYPDPNELG